MPSRPTPTPPPLTVGSVRALLRERGLSPEQFAVETGVSNMTWRRLLAQPDSTPLRRKYASILEQQFASGPSALDPQTLVVSGLGGSEDAVLSAVARDGKRTKDVEGLVRDVERKRGSVRALPRRLSTAIADLLAALPTASLAAKALIVGALLYFLNPFDLVADALIGIGFLDDVGVAALVLKRLSRRRASKEKPA